MRVRSGAVLDTAPATSHSHGSQSRNQFAGIKQTVPDAILPVPAAPLLRVPRVWRHGRVSLIRLLYQPHSPSGSRSRSNSPVAATTITTKNSESSPAKTSLAFCGVLSYLLLVFLRCHCHKGSPACVCVCVCVLHWQLHILSCCCLLAATCTILCKCIST